MREKIPLTEMVFLFNFLKFEVTSSFPFLLSDEGI